MAKLKISILGKEHELVLEGPLSVGRSPAAGLTLETAGVSREHALFKQTSDGRWAVKDLDSTNGTLVNGQAIKVTRLSHGDQIQFGKDVTVTFDDPPPKKEKKPVVFKSRAEREREAKEAAAYAKRMELKEKAKQKEREILGIAEAQGDTTMQIDTEGKLDSLLSEKEQFDALLHGDEHAVVFGPYKILSRISEGGMGYVFKAHHRGQKIDVALKVLRSAVVDENNIARFKQEAWAISAFDHPNIVKVRDLAKHGGMHYIAMDYVTGHDLLAVGLRRALTFWQIMEVIDKVADALRVVHHRNIWHRDIKPQNILLDRKGEPRLIDFGIATVEREQDDATKTAEGLIIGTPAFLSPEQAARGKMGTIDGRADLYSLGAVMYYLLTGRRPFTGRSPLEILKKNMTQKPRHPVELEELVPPDLGDIAMKLLEKHPGDRHQTAKDLRDALARWRKSKDGREEAERHRKIMKLRQRRKKA